jgi:ATP-dependent DNA ligase
MLLESWENLDSNKADEIENHHHAWCVQPKIDGCRALFHIRTEEIRVTSRAISEVTFRLTEHQDNVPHLARGLESIAGTILDGELVCPVAKIDTDSTVTESALQATVAILATTPENAGTIQARHNAHLEFHAYDILQFKGQDVTKQPLSKRLEILKEAIGKTSNPFVNLIPTGIAGKRAIHDRINAGGEGTVWKRLDQPYEPGRRVKHWLKRKWGIEVEAFVTGFKSGSADHGNRHLIGAVEFSTRNGDGTTRPVAWVSNWTIEERKAMTTQHNNGTVGLNPCYLGRRAIVTGQDKSARSRRLRHARLKQWVV